MGALTTWLGAAAAGTLLVGALMAGPAAGQESQSVTFIVVNNLFSTPAFVASEKGYWAKYGLVVTVKLVNRGSAVADAVQAGDAQFGHASFATTIASARASGNMLKGVMPYYNAAGYIAKAGGRAIVARRDRGIDTNRPKSMEGKMIAHLADSTNEVYLREWFLKNKVDISKSRLVSVPVEDMPIAIVRGRVDAIVPWEPYTAQAVRELDANAVVVSRGEEGLVTDIIGVVVNEEWAKSNYDLIEKFATGIAEATFFLRHNPQQAAEIATRFLAGLNVADATNGLEWLSWDPRLSVCNIEGLVKSGNHMVAQKLFRKDKPFVADDFYDDTVFKRVTAKHPELFDDLPALPKTLADCKGRLPY